MEKSLCHTYITPAAILLAAVTAVMWSGEIAAGIRTAADACVYTMIPSLYFMLILSGLFMKSGLCSKAARFLERAARLLFGCSGEVAVIFIVSQVAGYPVGCTMLSKLAEKGQITRKRASLLSGCCYGCGPAFIGAIFTVSQDGRIVFTACTLSNFILFLLCSRIGGKDDRRPEASSLQGKLSPVEATISGGKAMLRICAMVLLFGALFGMAEGMGLLDCLGERFENILSPFLEISRITNCLPYPCSFLPWLGAMVSFGGVCVLMQLGAASEGRVNLLSVFFMRASAALITFVIILLYLWFTSPDGQTDTSVSCLAPPFEPYESSPLPSFLLTVMTFMLLLNAEKE